MSHLGQKSFGHLLSSSAEICIGNACLDLFSKAAVNTVLQQYLLALLFVLFNENYPLSTAELCTVSILFKLPETTYI